MRVFLSRWICRSPEDNFARLASEAHRAAEAGAEMVVFPESFLHGYRRTVDPISARKAFSEISSANLSTLYFFGSISEDGKNRMTVWNGGEEICRYDKVHLFAPNGENEIWTPGKSYSALAWKGTSIGLLNCNDLRFPEQARKLKISCACDIFVAVAWWPWRRDSVWKTLLKARAIENNAWVVGCCVSASDHPLEIFSGAGNYVFNRLGDPVSTIDDNNYLIEEKGSQPLLVDPVSEAVDIKDLTFFNRNP